MLGNKVTLSEISFFNIETKEKPWKEISILVLGLYILKVSERISFLQKHSKRKSYHFIFSKSAFI
jgi:hypothetical protein